MNISDQGKHGPAIGALAGLIIGIWAAADTSSAPLVRISALIGGPVIGTLGGVIVWLFDRMARRANADSQAKLVDDFCCPKCGRRNPPESAACIKCGTAMSMKQ
jgi:hypothetical protein